MLLTPIGALTRYYKFVHIYILSATITFETYRKQIKVLFFRCFPSEILGQGVGDKLILRLVAFKLGLREVVTFPKRALQFGTRIANKKEKGSSISSRFKDISING